MICQIRGDGLDGAGTPPEPVHHICGTATLMNRPLVPSPAASTSSSLFGSRARLGMETARRLPEAESFWRTLPCPTWRHGVAFPLELHY
jgi:hypothetical protein